MRIDIEPFYYIETEDEELIKIVESKKDIISKFTINLLLKTMGERIQLAADDATLKTFLQGVMDYEASSN